MNATIEIDGLRKRFGPTQALDGMTFTVGPGQVTGFVGPNGAGKPVTGLRHSLRSRRGRWIGRGLALASGVVCPCPDLKVYRYLLVCSVERQLDGTGERVQAGQELQCEFLSHDALLREFRGGGDIGVPGVAAQVGAATVVFGMRRDRVLPASAILAVATPSRRGAQVQQPATGQRDQAVKADVYAVDRRQGDSDVTVKPW